MPMVSGMFHSALPIVLLLVVASLGVAGSSATSQKANLRRRCAGRMARRPR